MSRSARTTKKQKEFVINFLSENKLLLGRKINPYLPKINKLWEELTKVVNELGPHKTIKQWKESISEMKTNVRRRAKDVRYGATGTGGGAGVTDLEVRLLSLLSHLTAEGDDLPEAGLAIHHQEHTKEIPIYIENEMQEVHNIINNEVIGVAGSSNENLSNCIITSIEIQPTSVKRNINKINGTAPRKLLNKNRVILEEHDKTKNTGQIKLQISPVYSSFDRVLK